jgi:hypothetical protein
MFLARFAAILLKEGIFAGNMLFGLKLRIDGIG